MILQVHDFGFFLYDPSAIKFLSYDEIPLAPEAACVGLEIRVVGNDSGEKVYISRFATLVTFLAKRIGTVVVVLLDTDHCI